MSGGAVPARQASSRGARRVTFVSAAAKFVAPAGAWRAAGRTAPPQCVSLPAFSAIRRPTTIGTRIAIAVGVAPCDAAAVRPIAPPAEGGSIEGDLGGHMKRGFRQAIVSVVVFGAVLAILVSIDERVRDRFNDLVAGGGLSSWGNRAADLGQAVVEALRSQSNENAPLVVFAAVGGVLLLFMWKS